MSDEIIRPGAGLVLLSGTPVKGVRGVLVVADGNMAVQMADGSNNNDNPVPVTAGAWYPLQVLNTTGANTATLLGIL